VTLTAGIPLLAAPVRAEEVLRASGTGTALGTMRQLAVAFERANPGHRHALLPSVGSSGAFRAVADGALDIGLAGRPPKPGERALGIVARVYARTPFVFGTGPRSGVAGISADEAVRIYRGELERWPNGERVRVVLRPRQDVDTLILRAISPEMAAAVDVALAREGMLVASTNQQCNEILNRTPGSIGPTSLTQLLVEAREITPLAWNGVPPTLENLASGSYPLEKTLLVVVRASPKPAVRRFLAFLASREARTLIERTGNIAVPLPAAE
jgi:phosphate transport system substrate-binding protein